MKEQAKIQLKTITKLYKYADNVLEEDIKEDIAEPLEVIELEDYIEVTPEQAKLMGLEV